MLLQICSARERIEPVYGELLIRPATGHATLLHPFLYVIDSKRALSFGEAQRGRLPNICSTRGGGVETGPRLLLPPHAVDGVSRTEGMLLHPGRNSRRDLARAIRHECIKGIFMV